MNNSVELVVKKNNSVPSVIEGNSLYSYLEKIKKFPLLSEEEEIALLQDFQATGNVISAQKLVTSHLRLAAKIALTYKRYGLSMADIISEANIGLMQAVKKFDLDKKVRLSTYAIWWIKAQINDYILRSWSLVKIGTRAGHKKLFYNLARIKARLGLSDNKGLEPSVVRTIAKELVVEEKEVVEMNARLMADTSLNVSVSHEDEVEKIDFLVDKNQNIEDKLVKKQETSYRNKVLLKCLDSLDEREQYIIKNRMLRDKPMTLEDIGLGFNISRERVRQIEKKAFDKLKDLVTLALS